MVLSLPKNPKIDDLAAILGQLDTRVAAVEEYVGRNDLRISVLEGRQAADAAGLASHQAGAAHRQRDLDSMKQAIRRDRWLSTLKRRR